MNIFFDLDGTLIDSVPDICWSINQLVSRYDLGTLTLEQTRSFVGNGSRRLVEQAFDYFGQPQQGDALSQKTEEFVEIYMQHLTVETTFYPGVVESLNKLHQDGHHLFICTNKPIQPTHAILKDMQIAHLFQDVAGGDSFAERKPSPMPLLKLCEKHAITPEEAFMVGDSAADVNSGNKAGMQTILVTYGYNHGADLRAANHAIDHFADLIRLVETKAAKIKQPA